MLKHKDNTIQEQLDELKKQTVTVLEEHKAFLSFTKEYGEKFNIILNNINQLTLKNNQWATEFHRLLMSEYAQLGPGTRVYGILYVNMKQTNMRRMMMVCAPSKEHAEAIGQSILQREGEDPLMWAIEISEYLEIPINVPNDIVEKVDKKLIKPDKPIGIFLNDLNLVKDRFANTPKEKAMLTKLIKKISEVHK